jgi:hypothetical protein
MVVRLAETLHWNRRPGKERPTYSNHLHRSKTSHPTTQLVIAPQSNEAMRQTTSIPEESRHPQKLPLKGHYRPQLV